MAVKTDVSADFKTLHPQYKSLEVYAQGVFSGAIRDEFQQRTTLHLYLCDKGSYNVLVYLLLCLKSRESFYVNM